MAITTFGTTLEWGADASTTARKVEIKSFPDLGAAPTLHDVSTFLSKIKVTIPGRQEMDGLEFSYFLDADMENYEATVLDSNKELTYVLKFGEGGNVGSFTWKGQHQTWLTGQEGDAPLECKLLVAPSSAITKLKREDA